MPPRKVRTAEQQIADLEAQIAEIQGRIETRKRFTPARVRRERARLELSAADYGELVGVSGITIYNWEKGVSEPRDAQLDAWLAVLAIGKREAWKQLGYT